MSPIAPNRLGTPSRPLAALLMRHPPCPLAPRTSRFHGADGPYTGSAGRARAGIRNFPKKSRHLFARLSAGGNRIRTIGPAEKETAVERGHAADRRRLARRPVLNDPIQLSVRRLSSLEGSGFELLVP